MQNSDALTDPPSEKLPPYTCADALCLAAQDIGGVQLFLALLPPDLRAQVDLLLRAADWRHSGVLVPIHRLQGHVSNVAPALAVKRNGDFVVVVGSQVVRSPLTTS